MSAPQVGCQYDFLFILIACQQNKKSYAHSHITNIASLFLINKHKKSPGRNRGHYPKPKPNYEIH